MIHGSHGAEYDQELKQVLTRPDARLPQSRAGGQGPYLRSLHHLGRSSEAKEHKNPKKVKCDRRTDQRTDRRTDGPTKRGVESRSTRLKRDPTKAKDFGEGKKEVKSQADGL